MYPIFDLQMMPDYQRCARSPLTSHPRREGRAFITAFVSLASRERSSRAILPRADRFSPLPPTPFSMPLINMPRERERP